MTDLTSMSTLPFQVLVWLYPSRVVLFLMAMHVLAMMVEFPAVGVSAYIDSVWLHS